MISKKSQNYGQALFECESSAELFKQLKALSDLFTEPETLDFFLSFTVSTENKKSLLNKSLKHSSSLLKNFFFVLLDNRTFSLLPQIVSVYQNLMEEKNNLCTGTIYSPYPVSEERKKEIEELLQKFFNKKLELNQKEDKSLIGGIYVKAGGYIFNSTVKQQLKHFKISGG